MFGKPMFRAAHAEFQGESEAFARTTRPADYHRGAEKLFRAVTTVVRGLGAARAPGRSNRGAK